MKILWHSTAPFGPSSYSVQSARTVPSIVRAGYDVTFSTWYGLQGQPMPWQIMDGDKPAGQVLILPHAGGHQYAADTIQATYEQYKADCLITCCDVWVFEPKFTHRTNFCPWLPIDHDPAPQPVIDALQPALYPMVYSKWGVEILAKAGVKSVYVPEPVPANVFKPGDKQAARVNLKIPDGCDFLITMVSANKDGLDRKGFGEALQGFAKFAESHPGAFLYLHTNWTGPINIGAMAHTLGIKDKVIMCDQYAYNFGLLTDAYMVSVYQASDVLLNPCKSEGFCLPFVEAQMCGCPIAATDFSTTDEMMFAGWKIASQPQWSPGADSWRVVASIASVTDALEEAYRNRDNENLRRRARNGAVRFDTPNVFNRYWKLALKEIERLVEKGKIYPAAKAHNWAKVGLFNPAGELCFPCLDNGCEAERVMSRDGKELRINPTGFKPPLPLDIQDDPAGGVSKIIYREITDTYHLDKLEVQPGDVLLDIGAQVGVVSCYLAKKYPQARVIAFEPIPDNYKRLLRNIEANGLTNVKAFNFAVSGDGQPVTLAGDGSSNSGGYSAYSTPNGHARYTVNSITLPQIFERYEIDRARLLKIDCEGAEYEILGAGLDCLDRVDALTGEFHFNQKLPELMADGLLETVRSRITGPAYVEKCRIAD